MESEEVAKESNLKLEQLSSCVPIHVVASFKKVKAVVSGNSQLATVLQNSAKLAVSEDGKKVRRIHPITEAAIEELVSRIVIAEDLPEDHCYQNLMKIFSTNGSVMNVCTCQPQNMNGVPAAARSAKNDGTPFTNKVSAWMILNIYNITGNREMSKGMRKRFGGRENGVAEVGEWAEPQPQWRSTTPEPHGTWVSSQSPPSTLSSGSTTFKQSNEQHGASRHGEAATTRTRGLGPRVPDGTRGFSMGRESRSWFRQTDLVMFCCSVMR
ncbi:hypothetical protein Bca52824_003347 [Brassica carinata]|uniref:HTH La-type RNA-binding domain-containing protein n=1 Tax=Brassica carinata TaxID=52824 RepID=A0A8X8BEM4_BRACI|nr:hypothetical protein Bca52824_003347 [Brassica carinata]